MLKSHSQRTVGTVLLLLLLLVCLPDNSEASMRVLGSLGFEAYGYEDELEENHLWLFQSTRFSLYDNSKPLSFHFSGSYAGDNQDEFSNSGKGRFLKGYMQYGQLGNATKVKLGRFFTQRGVLLGVVDGIEIQQRINSKLGISLVGGISSPYTREFEFGDTSDDLTFGSELNYYAGSFWMFSNSSLKLSNAVQKRETGEFRNRVGISGFGRINSTLSMFAVAHLRLSDSLLKKVVARLRYHTTDWNAMCEAALITANTADYSWFADFGHLSYKRVRFSVDRYFKQGAWAGGLDGALLLSEKTGVRIGPVVTTPYGQLGYRLYSGDQALSDGPWASVRYKPVPGLELYAYGAIVSYEWEAFDIEAEDIKMFFAGGNYTPAFKDDITFSIDYEIYQTPQFSSDRSLKGGISWKFDSKWMKG